MTRVSLYEAFYLLNLFQCSGLRTEELNTCGYGLPQVSSTLRFVYLCVRHFCFRQYLFVVDNLQVFADVMGLLF